MSDDSELVAKIAAGDLNAFEELYHKYKTPLYRTAIAITRDAGVAEEVLQDTFLRAYRSLRGETKAARERMAAAEAGEPQPTYASLALWLHRIAVNQSYTHAQRLHRHHSWAHSLDALTEIGDLIEQLWTDPRRSPEKMAERRELAEAIHRAIETLDDKQRAVIVLFYLHEFSIAEIAYILNLPAGTVKSRLHYAIKRLRKHLTLTVEITPEVVYDALG